MLDFSIISVRYLHLYTQLQLLALQTQLRTSNTDTWHRWPMENVSNITQSVKYQWWWLRCCGYRILLWVLLTFHYLYCLWPGRTLQDSEPIVCCQSWGAVLLIPASGAGGSVVIVNFSLIHQDTLLTSLIYKWFLSNHLALAVVGVLLIWIL